MRWPTGKGSHRRNHSAEDYPAGTGDANQAGANGGTPRPAGASTSGGPGPHASPPIGQYPPRVYSQHYPAQAYPTGVMYHPAAGPAGWAPGYTGQHRPSVPPYGPAHAHAQAHEDYMVALALKASVDDYQRQQERVAGRQTSTDERARKAAEARSKASQAAAALSHKWWQKGR